MSDLPQSSSSPAGWRVQLGQWVEGPAFTRFIISLIIVNAGILGLETSPVVVDQIGGLLSWANALILLIFVIEIVIKLIAFGPRFFRSGWNIFDF
ncbi:MAG: ion transporter, partial [Pseudomonadota bacterium]